MDQEYLKTEYIIPSQRIAALATQIATALGAPWRIVPRVSLSNDDLWDKYSRSAKVAGADGELFHLGYSERKHDRIAISGEYPRNAAEEYISLPYGEVDASSITVALDRGPEIIAKEITRRFLPEYRRVLAIIQKRIAEADDYASAIAANTQRMAAAVGMLASDEDKKLGKLYLYRTKLPQAISGKLEVHRSDINLQLNSLSFEQAEAIFAVLRNGGGR